ncbi:MAG TPA: YlbE-like family protein [Firmicutes bacterium]|nr:YlbE-like family protein [Bacillales bacterium]HJA40448.1 YlbE-like family protein [Bacillota bacterium]
MRQDVWEVVLSNSDYHRFIQENPQWYRRLTRNPSDLDTLEISVKQYFKKSIPDRVGKLQQNVQLASMMIDLFQMMQTTNEG